MPRKKAVQSEAVVSSLTDLSAAAPVKLVRKRTAVKPSAASVGSSYEAPAVAEKKTRTTRKKADAPADNTTVAAVTHRHKKQEANVSAVTTPAAALPAVTTPVAAAAAQSYEPSHDEVAGLAYSYYVARGYQPGNPTADWFRAIEELKQRHLASLLNDPA